MAIIISKNGNNAQKIEETRFGLEDKLQEYVKNNPDIIPIYEIAEDARLLVLAREFPTNSGPIDALGVDQDGNIYVIETKLYKNPDKRTVLAQALDYGASLWRHSGDATDFIDSLETKVKLQFDTTLSEKIQDFFEVEDSQIIIDTMSKNVLNGNIKFVILMDTVDDRLKDLITYVNQNSRFDVYAVDLQYYKHDEFEIIIPKLYGSEVKKEVKTQDESNRFDNQKIVNWVNEWKLTNIQFDLNNTTKSYARFTTPTIDSIIPHREDNLSGWKNGNAYYYEIRTDKTGWVQVALELNGNGVNEFQNIGQQKVMDFVGKKPKKPEWQWFNAIGWRVDYQKGEAAIKNDLYRIFTEDIPAFESKLKAYAEK